MPIPLGRLRTPLIDPDFFSILTKPVRMKNRLDRPVQFLLKYLAAVFRAGGVLTSGRFCRQRCSTRRWACGSPGHEA